MVQGRSKQVFATWLADRPDGWRNAVDVVAMDGFTGFKTAAAEEVPEATAVMDPFHVVRLAGDALDRCRRRVQLAIHGHRGFKNDPLYKSRRTLHTGADLLTDKQIKTAIQVYASEDVSRLTTRNRGSAGGSIIATTMTIHPPSEVCTW